MVPRLLFAGFSHSQQLKESEKDPKRFDNYEKNT